MQTQKRALELYSQQLAFTREHGGRREEAKAQGNLGIAYTLKGDYARAYQLLERSLAMFRSLGDTASAALTMQHLANIQAGRVLPAMHD